MRNGLSPWWAFGSAVTMPFVRLLFRIRVDGLHHLPPSGSAILAFNHVSALDGPALAAVVARRRRRAVRFIVAAEWFEHPRWGWVLRRYEQIPIRRGARDAHALDAAIEAVRRGTLVALAPEGAVNPDPERGLQRLHRGCARIAIPADAKVIPVGLWGTQALWPESGARWDRVWKRPRLAIAFGAPLVARPGEDPEAFSDRLRVGLEDRVRRAEEM